MYSYRETMKWHKIRSPSKGEESQEISAVFDVKYIHSKLEQGLARIWQVIILECDL